MKTETKAILTRIIEIEAFKDEMKALYAEQDMLTMQLQDEGFQDAELNGFLLEMVDNFIKSNIQFRPAGVKRFEVKVKRLKGGA